MSGVFRVTKERVLFTFILVFAGQFVDWASTVYAMSLGAEEANPTVASVIEAYGNGGFALYKLSGVLVFTALTYWNRWFALLFAAPFFYLGVHNMYIALTL